MTNRSPHRYGVTKSSPREESGDTTGRGNAFASVLEPPGANFFEENADGHKKRKPRRREKRESLWKLTPLMGIRTEREFPPRLEKSLTYVRLFFSQFPQAQHRPSTVSDLDGSIFLAPVSREHTPERRTAD